MTRDDLALAVERHATSKLPDDDLLDIRTLGFRGEALPSIGAVARLTITTRHAGEPHAWAITVDAGEKAQVKPGALGGGTRVEVRDLFYATPARLKFLKSDRSEGEAIRDVVRRLAMSRPDVAFTLAGEERAPVSWAAALPGAARTSRAPLRHSRRRVPRQRGGGARRTRRACDRGLCGTAHAHSRQLARAISVRQRPAGARQAPDRRGARRLCRLSAARPPSDRGAVRHGRSARGRRQCASGKSRSAFPRSRPGAQPAHPRAAGGARARRPTRRDHRRQRNHRRVAACRDAVARDFGRHRRPGTGGARRRGQPMRAASPCPRAAAPRQASRRRPRRPSMSAQPVRRRARRGRRARARAARSAARRRPRAGARDLYRRADARRHRHRRPARRARAHRLRAAEGGARARPASRARSC